ncbi:ABC transporter permease [Cerasicoccus fimbriatus]|uniref:ABC transporter permease n=1 Tax=Cerasicoccus fimbriatus TaxID=3014554 RepID=UPI0022B5D554|nr:iron ABC transporter permease [Cerasicoccus sp. TK19100]
MNRGFSLTVYGISVAFFGCFLIWPILQILQGGFFVNGEFTLAFFGEVFSNPIYLEGLLNAFAMGVFSTILALLLALPLAFVADRYEFRGKAICLGAALLPIMLPPFVGAIGIQQILGRHGVFNVVLAKLGLLDPSMPIDWLADGRFWGIVVLNALSLYPILYLNAAASLANIDPAMEEAAENLGCRGWKKFCKITLPLMRPGLFAGCTIVFIWAFTELGVPLIFNYPRVTSVQIFDGLKEVGDNPFPYALVTVMLVFSVAFYLIGKGLFGRNNFTMMAKASHASGAKRPGALGQVLCLSLFAGVSFLALLPHLAVILISFSSDWYDTILPTGWTLHNYDLALSNGLTVPAIRNSLFYAGLATLVNASFGLAIAYVVVRSKLPGRGVLDTLSMLPLAVPGLVMAFGYFTMAQEGKFFGFLNPIENPTWLLIIAYAVRKLPFMVRSAVAGLQQTSETYEEAAQNLGCPPVKAAFKVTLPLITANLLAGAILAFSQSMLEVSDSLILAVKQEYYPITKAMFELMSLLGDGPYLACALGVWAMCFLAVTIIGANILLGKKMGAIFRV